mmetsp:Transcript_28622/g.77215  ORF Transcript_28622/g.77215 Transcript_28622/m.77215 type:complete len:239 (+) Transcript_28622:538-1254(+)
MASLLTPPKVVHSLLPSAKFAQGVPSHIGCPKFVSRKFHPYHNAPTPCYQQEIRLPPCASNRTAEVQQTVSADPHCCSPTYCYSCCWGPALSFGAAVALASYLLHKRERRPAYKEEPDMDLQAPLHPEDPRHHQRVLAKTRQAANIQNAATYQKAGEITKAMLELSKALNNNSVCRTPAMVMLSPEDLAGLYRLHITNTEHPPNFATLLQLQEMLGLSQEEAERVEIEVLQTPGAFAI